MHRSGKDSVDHGAHGSDDCANALAGCLYIAVHETRKPKMRWGTVDFAKTGKVTWKDDESQRQRIRIVTITEKEDLRQRGLLDGE